MGSEAAERSDALLALLGVLGLAAAYLGASWVGDVLARRSPPDSRWARLGHGLRAHGSLYGGVTLLLVLLFLMNYLSKL